MSIAPYGSWRSPITSQELFAKAIRLGSPALDGEDLLWTEMRPEGRSVIVRRSPDGAETDLTPPGFDARTRVHEYGGGAYLAARGTIYFSNFRDQRLYRHAPANCPCLSRLRDSATPTESWTRSDGG